MSKGIYAEFAPRYAERGIPTLPVTPGTKSCDQKGWNQLAVSPDWEKRVTEWTRNLGHYGIGVALGFQTQPGLILACADIDRNSYINVGLTFFSHLGGALVRKRGEKGTTIFFQAEEGMTNAVLSPEKSAKQKAAVEVFTNRKLTVLPPSIHPGTKQPYQWESEATLLDVDLTKLPIFRRK